MSSPRPKLDLDPRQPQAVFQEWEPDGCGSTVGILTVLLTARECPWRCVMCDLWKHTNSGLTPHGSIPDQVDVALATIGCERVRTDGSPHSPLPTQVKLYNSGSFFDPTSIPLSDHPATAAKVARFERVVVECHPRLIDKGVLAFQSELHIAAKAAGRPAPRLEVAMGLETAHPEVLRKLNKRMTLDHFRQAVRFLTDHQIDARAFILLRPPFLDEDEGISWACKSIDIAFDAGVRVASVIPTRTGNPDLDSLTQSGDFTPPRLSSLERVLEYGLSLQRGIVLADLWDLQRFAACSACYPARRDRLERMNLAQQLHPASPCSVCACRA